uniref:Uncharacterized protein n=1 Tax=Oryza glumipatula TaxID=40148 RepID=A0A0D9Z6T1_9ORYZ
MASPAASTPSASRRNPITGKKMSSTNTRGKEKGGRAPGLFDAAGPGPSHKTTLKGTQLITTKLSLPKFKKLLQDLTPDQQQLVRDNGFGTLLELKGSHIPRVTATMLAENFDTSSRTMKLQDNVSFKLDQYTVERILGIPMGELPIPHNSSKLALHQQLTSLYLLSIKT